MKIKHAKSRYLIIVLLVKSLKIISKKHSGRYREEKERKWDDDELVVSAKMQEAILLPKIPGLKVVLFCKRIVLLNEICAPIGGCMKGWKEKATGVLWHEARLSKEYHHQM